MLSDFYRLGLIYIYDFQTFGIYDLKQSDDNQVFIDLRLLYIYDCQVFNI